MKSKLRVYVENLFDGALKTEEVVELREEILQNVIDKYEDMLSEGKDEDEAYRIAVSGIGDVSELLHSLEGVSENKNATEEFVAATPDNKKSPKTYLLCISVAMYILSLVPVIFAEEVIGGQKAEAIAICIMFTMVAIATVILISFFASKPKSNSEVAAEKKQEDPALKSIESAIWAVITVVYLIVSFTSGAWFITWIIFVIGHAITEIIEAIFELRKSDK